MKIKYMKIAIAKVLSLANGTYFTYKDTCIMYSRYQVNKKNRILTYSTYKNF